MKKILINGYFFTRRTTGIERYAFEITNRLDKLSKPDEIALIVPGDCDSVPDYKNITVIRYGKKIRHILWQMFTLQFFLFFHRDYIILEFGNTCLPFFPGIVFLHDTYYDFFPEDFVSIKDKITRIYNRWQYRLITKKAKKIITVSCFSRKQISETHHIPPERISVIYSSWEHFKSIEPDYSVFQDKSFLKKKAFYFSLGSLSKRKNLRWIIGYAKKNPSSIFAISGVSLPTLKISELDNSVPKNIFLLGYLDDSKVKALMKECKAFILPSYYEGFGLTPLEALSCGAQIIIANAASLPEIYGTTAHYIDPFNTNIDLDQLILEPVEKPNEILEKYSYDTAARQTYQIIREQI